jgi:hypothetical protein
MCFYIPENDILRSHRRERIKYYAVIVFSLMESAHTGQGFANAEEVTAGTATAPKEM